MSIHFKLHPQAIIKVSSSSTSELRVPLWLKKQLIPVSRDTSNAPPHHPVEDRRQDSLEDPQQAVSLHLRPTLRPSASSRALAPHSWDGARPTAPTLCPLLIWVFNCGLHPKYFPLLRLSSSWHNWHKLHFTGGKICLIFVCVIMPYPCYWSFHPPNIHRT